MEQTQSQRPTHGTIPPETTTGCRLCGSKEIHSCTGAPIVWTAADVARLEAALEEFETD